MAELTVTNMEHVNGGAIDWCDAKHVSTYVSAGVTTSAGGLIFVGAGFFLAAAYCGIKNGQEAYS